LPTEFDGDVIVFPREVDPDGRGLYDDSVITIVKEFRIADISASYQHEQDSRSWIGEKAVPTAALDLLIGIASNAGWSALCWILRRQYKSSRVRVRVGRFRKTSTETAWEWYEVEGPGSGVAEALEAIETPAVRGTQVEQEDETKTIEK
jgi:hypothetical protein